MYDARFDTDVDTNAVIGCSNSFRKLSKTFMAIAGSLLQGVFHLLDGGLVTRFVRVDAVGRVPTFAWVIAARLERCLKLVPMLEKPADGLRLLGRVGFITTRKSGGSSDQQNGRSQSHCSAAFISSTSCRCFSRSRCPSMSVRACWIIARPCIRSTSFCSSACSACSRADKSNVSLTSVALLMRVLSSSSASIRCEAVSYTAWPMECLAPVCRAIRSNYSGYLPSKPCDLVGWGWNPGAGREPAPGNQEVTGLLVQAWIESGAECP